MIIPLATTAALTVSPATLLAEASTGGVGLDVTTLIGTLLTPVAVVLLLLANKLHTDGDYQRVVADLASERAERTRLQNVVNDKVIPRMARQNLVMEALLPLVQNEVRLRAVAEHDDGGE